MNPSGKARATGSTSRPLRAAPLNATDRTCEIGMTRATGRPYRHVLDLLDDATS